MKKTIYKALFVLFILLFIGIFMFTGHFASAKAEKTSNGIKHPPAIVCDVVSLSSFNELKKISGATALVTIDARLSVLDNNGKKIDTLDSLRFSVKDENILFAVRIEDASAMNSFVKHMNGNETENKMANTGKNNDIAVVSSKLDIIKTVRKNLRKIRAYYDASKIDLSTKKIWQTVVNSSNEAGANVVMLSENQANCKIVEYFQSRMKTVWVKCFNDSEISYASAISSGAYGVISSNPNSLKEFYGKYEKFAVPLNRAPLNIAHRGLPRTTYENSLEGCIQAYQGGATHLEIDVYATTDDQIVVMHDNALSRTTDCTDANKKINQMTLSEIRQYKIIKSLSGEVIGDGVEIPTLDDFFEYFKDKDIVLVIEDKDDLSNTLPSLLRQKIEQYNVWDKVVFIAFSPIQVAKLQNVLPEVPLGYLRSVEDGIAKSQYTGLDDDWENLAYMNCQEDPSNNSIMYGKIDDLIARGYLPFFWTYDNVQNFNFGLNNGVYGITNNCSDKVSGYARYLFIDRLKTNKIKVDKLSELNEVTTGYFVNYSGEIDEGGIVELFASGASSDGNYYAVFCRKFIDAESGVEYTLFSDKIKVEYEEDDIGAFNKSGCSSLFTNGNFTITLLTLISAGIVFAVRKKFIK